MVFSGGVEKKGMDEETCFTVTLPSYLRSYSKHLTYFIPRRWFRIVSIIRLLEFHRLIYDLDNSKSRSIRSMIATNVADGLSRTTSTSFRVHYAFAVLFCVALHLFFSVVSFVCVVCRLVLCCFCAFHRCRWLRVYFAMRKYLQVCFAIRNYLHVNFAIRKCLQVCLLIKKFMCDCVQINKCCIISRLCHLYRCRMLRKRICAKKVARRIALHPCRSSDFVTKQLPNLQGFFI